MKIVVVVLLLVILAMSWFIRILFKASRRMILYITGHEPEKNCEHIGWWIDEMLMERKGDEW